MNIETLKVQVRAILLRSKHRHRYMGVDKVIVLGRWNNAFDCYMVETIVLQHKDSLEIFEPFDSVTHQYLRTMELECAIHVIDGKNGNA